MAEPALAIYGTLIHSVSVEQIEIREHALLCADRDGRITHIEAGLSLTDAHSKLRAIYGESVSFELHVLKRDEFLIPGLIDTHNHAPQWCQRGLGRGLEILDWLDTITFKNEAKFADQNHARTVYTQAVKGFLRQGITTASYYGSLHGPATVILAEVCYNAGQRALIGKCNMDRNSPPFYVEESAEASLQATRDVIAAVEKLDADARLVKPILTPRFAISCTDELLAGLGRLAQEHPTLPIQTHFNEARSEIDATLSLFPAFRNEVDLYSSFGLLNNTSILAHCCHMTEYETSKLKALGCGIAHCPIANTTVGGGFMAAPIRKFLLSGIDKIGLGTDSGGGFSISILDAMRQAFIVSNARQKFDGDASLTIDECFYLATLGGAKTCQLEQKVGNFVVGKELDACLIRTQTCDGEPLGVVTPTEPSDTMRTIFEKFLMSGDDRNIAKVWIKGRQVKGS